MKSDSVNRDGMAVIRLTQAMQLRAQKLTYDVIAVRCGYASRGAAHNAVQRELQRIVVSNVEELRQEESAMLDQMHAEIWPLMLDKSNRARLFAVDRLLAISERRCKLMGLDIKPEEAAVVNMTLVRQVAADMEAV